MIPKYLIFAVALVSITSVAVAAMEIAILSQDADAKGCRTSVAVNASKGRCIKAEIQADNADESDVEEPDDDD